VSNKKRIGDSRKESAAFGFADLSSQTSKDNSRNYGDFSEEFREIDVILLRGYRLFVCGNARWDVADKEAGRRNK